MQDSACRTPDQLATSTDVSLVPWGRIEGILRIGKNIAPNQKVSAWLNTISFNGRVDYDAQTDVQGRFVLDRVTPGAITIYRYVDTPDHRGWIPSNPVFLEVKPGQALRVEVGGTGRPVIGQLKVPQGFALADLVCRSGELSTIQHEPRQPDDYPDYSSDQKDAWFENFYKTPEGKAFYQGGAGSTRCDLGADGTLFASRMFRPASTF